jgi:hypothetical protein
MKSITYTMMVLLISFSAGAAGQETPTLTIVNQAAEVAGVRVVGPTSGSIEVPSNGNRTIALSGGTYRLKVRYCDLGGRCRYSQTDPFSVTQTTYAVSRITVTLHSAGGNLNEQDISEAEFNGAR